MKREERLVADFRDLFNKMVWLNRIRMEERLRGFKPSEVHCIEHIGKNADSNVTKLAESFYMTMGAISKLTKKLIERGLIESYRRPDNRKEIYFRLTERGKDLYEIHEALHREFHERDRAVFDDVTEAQFDCMFRLVERYSGHLDAEIAKLSGKHNC